MITLPGLIDPHVHLRDPGQTHKEDFTTGTMAALAGGFTTILDMPNNEIPITTLDLLTSKEKIAKKKIVCDVGFYFGSLGDNLSEFKKVQDKIFGLKLYLNQTTGNFTINLDTLKKICYAWPKTLPILIHAEENILEKAINITHITNQRLHVCHVSSQTELEIIIKAKEKKYNITCGVTPHYLFLTKKNIESLGAYGKIKPAIKSQNDVNFLWKNIDKIDLIESDHSPHTKKEKESSESPFGFTGLETTLPLLLTAAHQEKLNLDDIKRLCHDKPAKIFGIQTDPQTYIEIDEQEELTIKNENLLTKCAWSPFNGWKVKGKVKKVFLHGTKVFEDGKILVKPGFGNILKPV
ncbi:amidohydrolase family protein [Patescibacteria group bacterium]|nr:amidohydrolase family protein [Patescibacteria group bacterium]